MTHRFVGRCWPACALVAGLLLAASAQAASPRAKPGKTTAKSGRSVVLRTVAVADGIVGCQSPHFWIVTDLPAEEAGRLLGRLETMLDLVAAYWLPDGRVRMARLQKTMIPCVVIRDAEKWPRELLGSLDRGGVRSAMQGGGLTVSQSLYLKKMAVDATAVVYASAAHNTTLHEVVHAFSQLAFATTGPTWYSEGMAENGKYWHEGEIGVGADPRVIEYLRATSPRKTLREVLSPFQATGDSWQNYAWRWALCHMLMTNPNYSADFRRLGMLFLDKGRVQVEPALREQFWLNDFQDVFAARWPQIEFEYLFLLDHLETGFRTDLAAWDWKKKSLPLTGSTRILTTKAVAKAGWQATGLAVVQEQKYDYVASGTWRIRAGGPDLSADGQPAEAEGAAGEGAAGEGAAGEGSKQSAKQAKQSAKQAQEKRRQASGKSADGAGQAAPDRRPAESDAGRLEAVILWGTKLTTPLLLGSRGTFTAGESGGLYVRCRDRWSELGDNSGTMTIRFRLHREHPPSDGGAESPAQKQEPKAAQP